jgi:sugar transferase (PEP-CTERM system associated)
MLQLFRVFIPASVIGLIFSEVILIALCYATGAWLVGEFLNPNLVLRTYFLDEGGLIQIVIVVFCLVAGLYFQNLYSDFRVKSLSLLIQQLCLVIGFAFLIQALLAYLRRPEWSLPRWAMIFGSILALAVVPAWRIFYGRVILRAVGFQKVLFMGASDVSQEIAVHLAERPEFGMRVLGYVDDADMTSPPKGGPVVGRTGDLTKIAQDMKPDLIVVGLADRRRQLPMAEMLHLRFSGVHFEEAAATFESTFGRVPTREIRPSRLVYSSELGPKKGSLFWHTLYAIPTALLLILIAAPIMVLVAIALKLTSPGPIFHKQVRVGLNGKEFSVFKFRSMYVDAEARTGPVWASKNDPRITPIGRWLRRLRLDELPQLFNVLRNEMALVGPRPERPAFVKSLSEQIPYYNYRHCVKPGITGWAQINYKYGETLEDAIMKLEYDLYYIKNLAISLDLYIIFHTLKVMLFSDTAQ